jgi:hypothetical protein
MIEKVESTEHYKQVNVTFSSYRRSGGFDSLHNPANEAAKKDRQSVLDYLNNYELVAIGIRAKILDEKFYKKWMLGPFVRDWNAAADFIQRERWKWDEDIRKWKYHSQLFDHYQYLAVKWSKEARVLNRRTSSPPASPEGPGDEAYPDTTGDKDESASAGSSVAAPEEGQFS